MPDNSSVSMLRGVGEMVRRAREAAGMTQAEVAARVGVTRSSIANLEQGRQDMAISRLAQVCRVLPAMDLNELVSLVDLPPGAVGPQPHAVTVTPVLETACKTCGDVVISTDYRREDARQARAGHIAAMLEKEAGDA